MSDEGVLVAPPPVAAVDNNGELSDADDPRHATYPRFVALAVLLAFTLIFSQIVAGLTVLPDTMITWLNHGVSCNGDAGKTTPGCDDANARYTLYSGISTSIGCAITFLASPLLGTISDSFGRRRPIIFCALLSTLQQASLVLYAWWNVSLYLYFALGILASFDSISVLLAYLSDAVPPSKRAFSFGLLFAGATGAVAIAPFIGSSVSVSVCFLLAFLTSCLYLLQCIFVLPESLAVEHRVPFKRANLNPFTCFRVLARYTLFRRLAAVVFVSTCVMQGKYAVNYSFLKLEFGMTEYYFGFVALAFGVIGLLTQSVVLKLCIKYFSNQKVMLQGLVCTLLNMIAYCFIWKEWQIFLCEVVSAGGYITFPAISAMKSNNVGVSEQGLVQGALYGVRQLASGLGPVVFSVIWSQFTSDSAPYQSARVIWYFGVALALAAVLLGMSVPVMVSAEEKERHEAALAAAEHDRMVAEVAAEAKLSITATSPLMEHNQLFIQQQEHIVTHTRHHVLLQAQHHPHTLQPQSLQQQQHEALLSSVVVSSDAAPFVRSDDYHPAHPAQYQQPRYEYREGEQ